MYMMKDNYNPENIDAYHRLEHAYKSQKPRFLARLHAIGRSLEEAEDLVHDIYAEIIERIPLISSIRNLPVWINWLLNDGLLMSDVMNG
jgi:DNA-directed RNA polymerase specialized sigma24 family protein